MAAFFAKKGDSAPSNSEEQGPIFQRPVDVSGLRPENISETEIPHNVPAQAAGGEGNDAVVAPELQPRRSQQHAMIHAISPEGEPGSVNPQDDPEGDNAAIMGNPKAGSGTVIPFKTQSSDGEQGGKRTCFKTICFCRVMCPILVGLFMLATGISAVMCWSILQHNQEHNVKTTDFELLQSDTILVYSGNGSSVEFSACFEVDSDDSTRQLDVRLIAVNCDDLIKRNSTANNDIPHLSFTEERPIYKPSPYRHYEIGSTFDYSIISQDVPASSGVDIRIFDNTTEADFYKGHHNDPNARDKAIWVKPVKTNTSFHACFNASFGSYFIGTIDPQVAGGHFEIDLSYSVNRIYYLFTDYANYTVRMHFELYRATLFQNTTSERNMCTSL